MTDFKPCPFCGCNYLEIKCEDYYSCYWVRCPNCGVKTDEYSSEKKAIEAWNMRE